jgi:hypothetical protein
MKQLVQTLRTTYLSARNPILVILGAGLAAYLLPVFFFSRKPIFFQQAAFPYYSHDFFVNLLRRAILSDSALARIVWDEAVSVFAVLILILLFAFLILTRKILVPRRWISVWLCATLPLPLLSIGFLMLSPVELMESYPLLIVTLGLLFSGVMGGTVLFATTSILRTSASGEPMAISGSPVEVAKFCAAYALVLFAKNSFLFQADAFSGGGSESLLTTALRVASPFVALCFPVLTTPALSRVPVAISALIAIVGCFVASLCFHYTASAFPESRAVVSIAAVTTDMLAFFLLLLCWTRIAVLQTGRLLRITTV